MRSTVVSVLVLTVCGAACQGDQRPDKQGLDRLRGYVASADAVVIGRPDGEKTESFVDPIVTRSTVRIEKVLHGSVSGSKLTLEQPGVVSRPASIRKDSPLVKSSSTYLLVMKRVPDAGVGEVYSPVNGALYQRHGSHYSLASKVSLPQRLDAKDLTALGLRG